MTTSRQRPRQDLDGAVPWLQLQRFGDPTETPVRGAALLDVAHADAPFAPGSEVCGCWFLATRTRAVLSRHAGPRQKRSSVVVCMVAQPRFHVCGCRRAALRKAAPHYQRRPLPLFHPKSQRARCPRWMTHACAPAPALTLTLTLTLTVVWKTSDLACGYDQLWELPQSRAPPGLAHEDQAGLAVSAAAHERHAVACQTLLHGGTTPSEGATC